MTHTTEIFREDEETGEEQVFTVEVDYYPFVPGRFSGPPEKCYEDEGGFVELCRAVNAAGVEVNIELTDKENQEIYDQITEDNQVDRCDMNDDEWEHDVCPQYYDGH
jgi:hypothetical protein